MFFSSSSDKASFPTWFLGFCYCVALFGICALIKMLYADANPAVAVGVANQLIWWMVGSGMIAGALAAWQVNAETLPGPLGIIKSLLILGVFILSGLLSAPFLLRSWVLTVEGDPESGRFYLAFHFLPSPESVLAAMVYLGVSYLLVLVLPLLCSYARFFKVLAPVVLLSGVTIMGSEIVGSWLAKQDLPTPGPIRTEVRAQTEEEQRKWLELDCDAGNGKACLNLVFAERRHAGEEGERNVYTKVCQRNIQMEFPPCPQLVEILSHTISREAAIDQVCSLNLDGCEAVGKELEAQYTMLYAQRAYRFVCGKQPESESCQRARELDALLEPELITPPQPTEDGPFCDYDPKSCLGPAMELVKEGRYDHAAWLYYTWCKSNKYPLEDCGMWLQLARWRTYFAEELNHLLAVKALKAPVDNPIQIKTLIDRLCMKGDGKSCFFSAALKEIANPKDIETNRKMYQRACELGDVRGCTNALSISSRHPGEGMPLPLDADTRYRKLCFDQGEVEACSELADLSVKRFESTLGPEREQDRPRVRVLLEQTCQREVAARLGNKNACRQFNRLKRIKSI